MAAREPPLDEIVWSQPYPQGINSNTILYYFADSPFFDRTSNNAVLISQGMSNMAMREFLFTREAFEGRLRSMSGLEFVVAQEPAESAAAGMGTGVWVIKKQTRRRRIGEEDDVTVHAAYFVVGEHVYMAPTLGDIFSSRIATISNTISKIFPAADSVSRWTAAHGRVYEQPPASSTAAALKGAKSAAGSKEGTPMPDGLAKPPSSMKPPGRQAAPDSRLAEESFAIHLRYGGDYMDENPITGKPGEFHLSSTGRKDNASNKLAVPAAGGGSFQGSGGGSQVGSGKDASGAAKEGDGGAARNGKADKSPKAAANAAPKPRRKKSKAGPVSPT